MLVSLGSRFKLSDVSIDDASYAFIRITEAAASNDTIARYLAKPRRRGWERAIKCGFKPGIVGPVARIENRVIGMSRAHKLSGPHRKVFICPFRTYQTDDEAGGV